MHERTDSGYGDVLQGDLKVPQKVAASEALDLHTKQLVAVSTSTILLVMSHHSTGWSIAP